MTLKTTALAGTSVLVEGTDIRGTDGAEVLDSSQWDEIQRKDVFHEALSMVDAAIAELVAPITAAVEAANQKLATPELDPLFYVVESDEVEHVAGQPRMLTKLNRDSVILRAIESGQTNRLIWVQGQLAVTKVGVTTVVVPELEPVTDSE